MVRGDDRFSLYREDMDPEIIEAIEAAGYPIAECLLYALPHGDYNPRAWRVEPARPTRVVDDGDVVSIGNRHFEVLHLPGHSPGSVGLWEAATGTLFSGDAVYDGPLLDMLPESDIESYCLTMERLMALPVTVVHAATIRASAATASLNCVGATWSGVRDNRGRFQYCPALPRPSTFTRLLLVYSSGSMTLITT